MIMVLKRKRLDEHGTLGELWVGDRDKGTWFSDTLERPIGTNRPNLDAITAGIYTVKLTESNRVKNGTLWSPDGKTLPLLLNVTGREGIRIHAGNSPENVQGCIIVGKQYQNALWLTDSRKTLKKLMEKLEAATDEIIMEIV